MRKFISVCITALAMTCLQSCYYMQDDVFEDSTAIRVQERVNEALRELESQKYGWVFEMYPASDLRFGGVVYTLQFKDGSVSVRSEIDSPETEVVSMYKVRTNNGPTLTFDTYNSLLHYYATPSSTLYEARGGEFEFLICDVKDGLIELQGTRTGNSMFLRALEEPAQSYLERVSEMKEFLMKWDPVVGDDEFKISIKPRLNLVVMTDSRGGGKVTSEMPFAYTPEGVRFYKEASFKDEKFETMTAVADKDTFGECVTSNGTSLKWVRPKGWHRFEDYELDGEWMLNAYVYRLRGMYQPFSVKVTLTADPENETFRMSGVWDNDFDIILNYNLGTGYLEINPQRFDQSDIDGFWYWLTLGYTNSPVATYFYSTATFGQYLEYGVQLVEEEEGLFNFEPNSSFLYAFSDDVVFPSIGIGYRSEDGKKTPGGTRKPESRWLLSGYDGVGDMVYDCRLFMMTSLEKL